MLILGLRYSIKNDHVYIYEKNKTYILSVLYPTNETTRAVIFNILVEDKSSRFTLALNDSRRIGDTAIELIEIDDTYVKIGFTAPKEVIIKRYKLVRQEVKGTQ